MQAFLRKCIASDENVDRSHAEAARKADFLLQTTYHEREKYFIIVIKGMI